MHEIEVVKRPNSAQGNEQINFEDEMGQTHRKNLLVSSIATIFYQKVYELFCCD